MFVGYIINLCSRTFIPVLWATALYAHLCETVGFCLQLPVKVVYLLIHGLFNSVFRTAWVMSQAVSFLLILIWVHLMVS